MFAKPNRCVIETGTVRRKLLKHDLTKLQRYALAEKDIPLEWLVSEPDRARHSDKLTRLWSGTNSTKLASFLVI
jgi:hypothetical protein